MCLSLCRLWLASSLALSMSVPSTGICADQVFICSEVDIGVVCVCSSGEHKSLFWSSVLQAAVADVPVPEQQTMRDMMSVPARGLSSSPTAKPCASKSATCQPEIGRRALLKGHRSCYEHGKAVGSGINMCQAKRCFAKAPQASSTSLVCWICREGLGRHAKEIQAQAGNLQAMCIMYCGL